jgi:hypothetical protein
MLHADLLGFQTYDNARHFLSACESILFCEVSPMGVEFQDHFTEVRDWCVTVGDWTVRAGCGAVLFYDLDRSTIVCFLSLSL